MVQSGYMENRIKKENEKTKYTFGIGTVLTWVVLAFRNNKNHIYFVCAQSNTHFLPNLVLLKYIFGGNHVLLRLLFEIIGLPHTHGDDGFVRLITDYFELVWF